MTGVRVESDRIGKVDVPADKLWGCNGANQGKVFHAGMRVTTESVLPAAVYVSQNGLATVCADGSV